MKLKNIVLALGLAVCSSQVEANDAYKEAHAAWLKARGEFYTYCATKTEKGIKLSADIEQAQKEAADLKEKLSKADPKLAPLFEKFKAAEKAYAEDKGDRYKRNQLTMDSRAYEGAWKNSELAKNAEVVAAQQKIRQLQGQWRNIYVGTRSSDPEAQKLWDLVGEASKKMAEAKKQQ